MGGESALFLIMKFNLKRKLSISNGAGKGYTTYPTGVVEVDDSNTYHISVLNTIAERQEDIHAADVEEEHHWLNLNHTIDTLVDSVGIHSVEDLAAKDKDDLLSIGFTNSQINKLA
jgi:hypothetical protein